MSVNGNGSLGGKRYMRPLKEALVALTNTVGDVERTGDEAGASRLLKELEGVRAIKLRAQD